MFKEQTMTPGGVAAEGKRLRSGHNARMKEWSRSGVRGFTYLYTGRGPLTSWLKKIGKSNAECECGATLDLRHALAETLTAEGLARRKMVDRWLWSQVD